MKAIKLLRVDVPESAMARMFDESFCELDHGSEGGSGKDRGDVGVGLPVEEKCYELLPRAASDEALLIGLVVVVVEGEVGLLELGPGRDGAREGSAGLGGRDASSESRFVGREIHRLT